MVCGRDLWDPPLPLSAGAVREGGRSPSGESGRGRGTTGWDGVAERVMGIWAEREEFRMV